MRELVTTVSASAECFKTMLVELGIAELDIHPGTLRDVLEKDMYMFGYVGKTKKALGFIPYGKETSVEPFTEFVSEMVDTRTPAQIKLPGAAKFEPKFLKPKTISAMMHQVHMGVANRHPYIEKFICQALTNHLDWFTDLAKAENPDHYRYVERVVHHMFLLEQLMHRIITRFDFSLKMQDYFLRMKHAQGLDTSSFLSEGLSVAWKTKSPFDGMKLATIDKMTITDYNTFRAKQYKIETEPVVPEDATEKEKAKQDMPPAELLNMLPSPMKYLFGIPEDLNTYLERKNAGLSLNIVEAQTADFLKGNKINSAVGSVLKAFPVLNMYDDEKNEVKHFFVNHITNKDGTFKLLGKGDDKYTDAKGISHVGKGTPLWGPLYETWNLAFVFGNLPNLDLILPKLLIPLVSNAAEEDYLYHRAITLWTTINIVLQRYLRSEPMVPLPDGTGQTIAKEWGKLNGELAAEILEKNGDNPYGKTGKELFEEHIGFVELLKDGEDVALAPGRALRHKLHDKIASTVHGVTSALSSLMPKPELVHEQEMDEESELEGEKD